MDFHFKSMSRGVLDTTRYHLFHKYHYFIFSWERFINLNRLNGNEDERSSKK